MDGKGTAENNDRALSRKPQFWRLAMRCCQIAGSVDVVFFFLFHALGSPLLAWVNVLSVALYTGAFLALRHRRNSLAVILIWLEVLVHAGLGVVVIGWESGFYYYLLMFIPAICVSAPLRWMITALLCLWGYCTAFYVLTWFLPPLQPLPEAGLRLVYLFNLSVVFSMFSYLSFYYLQMVVVSQRQLRKMALTDPLTGLLNRRQITFLADKVLARFRRGGCPVVVLLMDVDHFKGINDRFGHNVGDQVLQEIAGILQSLLRGQDLIGRWGGEEFLVILPDTDTETGRVSAERIRQTLMDYDWQALTGEDVGVTMSTGVSELRKGETLGETIRRADQALYNGKVRGRNRVELEPG